MYANALMAWPEQLAPEQPLAERCKPASREDLEQLENGVSAQVLLASLDANAAPVSIRYKGRTILARPLDTRRFVQEMAAFISFN